MRTPFVAVIACSLLGAQTFKSAVEEVAAASPFTGDGRIHSLVVRVTRPDDVIRARRHYLARKDESA
jgi:hypothetical protein